MDAVLRAGSGASLVLLLAGVLWWMLEPQGSGSLLLNAGLVLLMITPVARVLSALVEEIRVRDWRFATLGFAVLALLGCSVGVALWF